MSGSDRRGATIVAIEPLELLFLTRIDFERLRESHPELNRFLFAVIARRMKDMTTQLLEALNSTAEQRVFARLQSLTELFGKVSRPPVRIPLTQEQLASLAGTTRPTANKILREIAEAGAVRLGRGYVVIRDPELLQMLARKADGD